MKKILFSQIQNVELLVENGRPRGGSAVETLVWMKALHENGYDIYQFRHEDDQRKVLKEYNWVNLVPIYDPGKGMKWLRWITHRWPSIYKALKRTAPDFYYESIPGWSSYFSALACRKMGIKYIVRIANDNMLDERILLTHSKFEQFFIRETLKQSDRISAQNIYQYQRLRSLYPQKKILKISNPIIVHNSFINSPKENLQYIAWVANFRFQKNLKLLYEIAKLLDTENFKIAGEPLHNMDTETEEYIKKISKLGNVEFIGVVNRESILEFLLPAKYLLNTSRYEGFSNTFLEAMVTGTPIITTPAVNPDEIISKYNLGIIYSEPSELKESLTKITEEEYRIKSHNCREYLKSYHEHLQLGGELSSFLHS